MSEFLVCHWSDLTKPLYHQTKHQLVVWLKQAKINIWNWALKATILFYKIFYDKEHISPPGKNTCERNSLSLPGTHFVFLILLFSKFRTQKLFLLLLCPYYLSVNLSSYKFFAFLFHCFTLPLFLFATAFPLDHLGAVTPVFFCYLLFCNSLILILFQLVMILIPFLLLFYFWLLSACKKVRCFYQQEEHVSLPIIINCIWPYYNIYNKENTSIWY